MSADDAIRWLETAEPKPPEALLIRIREAIGEASGRERGSDAPLDAAGRSRSTGSSGSAPSPPDPRRAAERFVAAALGRLSAVLRAEGDRGTALDLLAADALLTYACEAAAEAGPEAVDAVTRAFGPDALAAALLEESA